MWWQVSGQVERRCWIGRCVPVAGRERAACTARAEPGALATLPFSILLSLTTHDHQADASL
jgi:hypothetical protein